MKKQVNPIGIVGIYLDNETFAISINRDCSARGEKAPRDRTRSERKNVKMVFSFPESAHCLWLSFANEPKFLFSFEKPKSGSFYL